MICYDGGVWYVHAPSSCHDTHSRDISSFRAIRWSRGLVPSCSQGWHRSARSAMGRDGGARAGLDRSNQSVIQLDRPIDRLSCALINPMHSKAAPSVLHTRDNLHLALPADESHRRRLSLGSWQSPSSDRSSQARDRSVPTRSAGGAAEQSTRKWSRSDVTRARVVAPECLC